MIPRRATIKSRLTLAAEADAHAIINACGDIHLEGFVRAYPPAPITFAAGLFDFLPSAMAGGPGLLHAENTLLHAYGPRTATGPVCFGRGTRLGPRPLPSVTFIP